MGSGRGLGTWDGGSWRWRTRGWRWRLRGVMARLRGKRLVLWQEGMAELPWLPEFDQMGRNGEELATDEAAVWKRVLDLRVARWLRPDRILETHAGLGIGTALFRYACPQAEIVALRDWRSGGVAGWFGLVDVDPFGQSWDVLEVVVSHLSEDGILMVSNGEALAVWRNLRKQQRYPTGNFGKRLPIWVVDEYLPRLGNVTGLEVQFFYAFPTSVRVILSNREIPVELWRGCPRWMWWLEKYAGKQQLDFLGV